MDIKNVRSDKNGWLLSLRKLTGLKIADVEGYVSREFGDEVFKVCEIFFEDGSSVTLSGEHDIAYLEYDVHEPIANLDAETLENLYRQK